MTLQVDSIINGDCRKVLKEMETESVHCCVTSPPYYGLRDYGITEQIGREATPEEYICKLVEVFGEVNRVLRRDGTLWIVISDSYCGSGSKGDCRDPKNPKGRIGQRVSLSQKVAGCKSKDLIGIPWMLAFALRESGWYLRSDIIWHKNNPTPETVKDRPTRSYEHIFLLSKARKYYYDYFAIAEPCSSVERVMRNKRDVWQINTVPFKGEHFAAYPPLLAETCIVAGCPDGGVVLDPFFGSGTTGIAANKRNRHFIGIELNPDYCQISERRIGEGNTQIGRYRCEGNGSAGER